MAGEILELTVSSGALTTELAFTRLRLSLGKVGVGEQDLGRLRRWKWGDGEAVKIDGEICSSSSCGRSGLGLGKGRAYQRVRCEERHMGTRRGLTWLVLYVLNMPGRGGTHF